MPKEAETMSMLFPADPSPLLEDQRRRTALEKCLGVIRSGTNSGKSVAQRIKGVFKRG
jgi:hypothetical protein